MIIRSSVSNTSQIKTKFILTQHKLTCMFPEQNILQKVLYYLGTE